MARRRLCLEQGRGDQERARRHLSEGRPQRHRAEALHRQGAEHTLEVGHGRHPATDLLQHGGGADETHAGATVLLGERSRHEAGGGQLCPEQAVDAIAAGGGVVLDGPHPFGR